MAKITFGGREVCFVPIPKTFMKHFANEQLTGTEHRVIDAIALKTFGWKTDSDDGSRKMEDYISRSQIEQDTGLPEVTVRWCLKNLIEKRIIVKKECGKSDRTATLWTWHNRLFDNRDNPLSPSDGTGIIQYPPSGITHYPPEADKGDNPLSPQKKEELNKRKEKRESEFSEDEMEKWTAECEQVRDHWNEKVRPRCLKFTASDRSSIAAWLNIKLPSGENITVAQLNHGIDNYALVQRAKPGEYSWSYTTWSLKHFMQRGVERFMDDSFMEGIRKKKAKVFGAYEG